MYDLALNSNVPNAIKVTILYYMLYSPTNDVFILRGNEYTHCVLRRTFSTIFFTFVSKNSSLEIGLKVWQGEVGNQPIVWQ